MICLSELSLYLYMNMIKEYEELHSQIMTLSKEIKYMSLQKEQRVRKNDFEIEAMETEEFEYWLNAKRELRNELFEKISKIR